MKEMKFGSQLRELRKKRGLSQIEAANKLGLKQNTFSHYENGKSFPDMATLIKIAEYFKVSLDELVYSLEENTKETINDHEEIFVDLEKGLSIEEMANKYSFVVNGEELPKENKKEVLNAIKYEYFKMKGII